jgi:DNA topoisomerase-2
MNAACALTQVKEDKVAKKTDGSKSKSIRGIPKLIDANYAGTAKSGECTLILCEGDSAKAGIISGLSKEDRNIIGVYPMKGKIFNTRGETLKRIGENKEIVELKQILGLETGKKYTKEIAEKTLRYNSILFMTDQDLDGSHIKGLGLNLFQDQWNSLSTLDNFIGFMNTPIIKAKKNGQEKLFYNDGEYKLWKDENDTAGWNIKYYKGLGTSTGKEFKEYFTHKKIVYFRHDGKVSDDIVDMIFNKKRSEDRKEWLSNYDRNSYLNTNDNVVSYTEFINKELIHFSKYDCERSIPNMMDGLKISLRKILFSAFKKNLTTEIKVAQFSGYVSEQSGYHHGEASLNAAIVGMAQDYVGSNNINLLMPNGQYGSRLQGGKDSASERYIFTQLSPITRYIYRKEDDAVLDYLEDDGFPVEPLFYVPIVPMILVNGGKGIGTGFSTDVLCYSVDKLVDYLQCKLKCENTDNIVFTPYYRGFHGTCQESDTKKYIIKGVYNKINDKKVRVTELPIGYWTDDFKLHIENLMEADKNKKNKSIVKDYNDMSTDTTVDIEITLNDPIDETIEGTNHYNNFEKTMKLYNSLSTNNMHLFNDDEKLLKFDKEKDIIEAYYPVRLKYYQKRKDYMINSLQKELLLLSNKTRYIQSTLSDEIDLRKKSKETILSMLNDHKYDIMDGDNDYKYLLKMPMDSVSEENVNRLLKDKGSKEAELTLIQSTSIEHMWLNELEELKRQLSTPKTIMVKKQTKK